MNKKRMYYQLKGANNMKKIYKKICLFVSIAYFLPWLLIALSQKYFLEMQKVMVFTPILIFTCYLMPAFGVMILEKKEMKKYKIAHTFYILFIIYTIFSLFMAIVAQFIIPQESYKLFQSLYIFSLLIAIGCGVCFLKDDRENGTKYNSLNFNKNIKIGLVYIFLYLLAIPVVYIVIILVFKRNILYDKISFFYFINIIIMWFIYFPFLFGQEYAWRATIQPKMISMFGELRGVILSSFFSAIWYFPIYMFDSNTNLVNIGLNILIMIFLSLYLGLAFLKTQNLLCNITILYVYTIIPGITVFSSDNQIYIKTIVLIYTVFLNVISIYLKIKLKNAKVIEKI